MISRRWPSVNFAGFDVHVYGQDHALIYEEIPLVVNTGFLIDGDLFHPGDAFTVPDEPVRTLLLPIAGPWLTAAEMIGSLFTARSMIATQVRFHSGLRAQLMDRRF